MLELMKSSHKCMTGYDRVISYIIGQNKLLLGTHGDGNGGKIGQKGVKMAKFANKSPLK